MKWFPLKLCGIHPGRCIDLQIIYYVYIHTHCDRTPERLVHRIVQFHIRSNWLFPNVYKQLLRYVNPMTSSSPCKKHMLQSIRRKCYTNEMIRGGKCVIDFFLFCS